MYPGEHFQEAKELAKKLQIHRLTKKHLEIKAYLLAEKDGFIKDKTYYWERAQEYYSRLGHDPYNIKE